MLELEGVSKQLGRETHIADVSLSLERGSLNVLLGPTLSGKTSLMRLMAGLDRPTDGRVLMDGKDVTGFSVRDRDVAMVYQQFINYPSLTVYENIASPMRIAKVAKKQLDTKVREAAELLKLTPFLDRTPLNLSGGQQQRTALARALVKGAELVLLDEPLANLDYKLREELRVELPRLFAETGAIFVYATTEPHEALLLGGRTATLHEGRLTQFGPTIDVHDRPADLITARTFADPPLNTASVRLTDGRLRAGERDLGQISSSLPNGSGSSLPDGDYTLGLRAHHVSLTASEHHQTAFAVRVGTSEITGSETYVHVDPGLTGVSGEKDSSHWVVLTHGVHRLNAGDALTVHLDPSRYYLFDASGALAHAPAA
jgi:glycerol transport system ATP-binding protein